MLARIKKTCHLFAMVLPEEIVGLHRHEITIRWEDEHTSIYNARELRLHCHCAFCIEEMTGQPLLDATKIPQDLVPNHIELLGQYAIAIHWSDGHNTSVYRFRDLRKNCQCNFCKSLNPKT